ncbi:nucleoid-associated protein YejK [Thorsellia anophelis]|uniref:Nucleoid-associated protein n=1 Tax=Thorsellia anophelis DSM 18579 TaxID=1123402 RepID=A0A1I0BBD9_9GAMM|nr:nucleoid-associated protein YejK [Thorsellia anophelis]SET03775.1 nucleoid-associated protein [Thorsellia anophelis DSM 18579]
MSINIKYLALHQLVAVTPSQPDEGAQVSLLVNEKLIENSPIVESMMEKLHQLYSMKNKGFAVFTDPSNVNLSTQSDGEEGDELENDKDTNVNVVGESFLSLFQSYYKNQDDFLSFSLNAANNLVAEINQYSFAEPGLLLMCHYHHVANDYLFIAQLTNVHSTTVNQAFEIKEIDYLDIEKSDIMARLDITEWSVNQDSSRYLTFLRGRIGRKVGDFFLDFLGAETGLDPKVQTQALVQAIDDYCQQHTLAKEEEKAYKQEVFSYCQTQAKQGEELSIQALSDFLAPDSNPILAKKEDVVDLASFTQEQGYQFPESFPADASTLKKLTKFSGSGGGVTISFTSAQLGEKVVWDKTTDTLVIKGTPPNLRDQLERFYD